MGAHLAASHAEVIRFPDNYVFSEPQFITDADIPLVDVQQSLVVHTSEGGPTFIAFGFNDDQATIVLASLAPLVFAVSESQPLPTLNWRSIDVPDLSFDFTARKLLTISRQADHDTLVILAANAESLYFVDLTTGNMLCSFPFDCDSVLDMKYSAETRQLGLLLSTSLLIHEVAFPQQSHEVAVTPESLTPRTLETMKVVVIPSALPFLNDDRVSSRLIASLFRQRRAVFRASSHWCTTLQTKASVLAPLYGRSPKLLLNPLESH